MEISPGVEAELAIAQARSVGQPDWPQANPASRNPDSERVIAPLDHLIQAEESRPTIERRFGFVILDQHVSLKD
jgi:hypothetical protein